MDSVAMTSAPSLPEPQSSWFPRWLLGIGLVVLFESGVLTAGLIWEQTALTWERGLQSIGFTLLHGSGAFLAVFPPLLAVWLAVSIAYTLWRLLRRRPLSRVSMITMVLAIGLLWIHWLPFGFWQRLFVDRIISGPHVGELFFHDVAMGDVGTVKAFIAHGTPVDLRVRGRTALHAAAAGGQTEVIKHLIAAGADINATATDGSGASALDLAISRNHREAAAYLLDHGARMVRATVEKPTKASEVVP